MSEAQIETLLERCGLAPSLIESPSGLIAVHAGEKFLCSLVDTIGDANFGFASVFDYREVTDRHIANIPLPNIPSGLDAACAFVAQLDAALTGTRILPAIVGDTFWILRSTRTSEWSESWPVVQFNLAIMLGGMRALFGEKVAPVAVKIGGASAPDEVPEALAGVPMEIGATYTGLGFSTSVLHHRTVSWSRTQPATSQIAFTELSQADASSVCASLGPYLRSSRTDHLVERVAESFGVSVRSYQRHLARLGTSHSELVDDARLGAAYGHLRETDQSITMIALELGYAHPGDFARFFRSRIGLTPTEFRAFGEQ
jgi:AraC-like DNA-binding protein